MTLPFLSTADLQQYSDLIQTIMMPDSCNILRESAGNDGQGGGSTQTTIGPFPCAVVDLATPREQYIAQQIMDRVGKKLLLPRNTDVHEGDLIQVINDQIYRVMGSFDKTSFEPVRRILITPEVA